MTLSPDALEEVRSLLSAPGWRLFREWAEAEYGPQILTKAASETDTVKALSLLQQAVAIRGAMQVMLEWPARTVKQTEARIEQDQRPPEFSRRGGL